MDLMAPSLGNRNPDYTDQNKNKVRKTHNG